MERSRRLYAVSYTHLGAMNFDASVLNGSRLINLDSEEEGVFVASCCGGAKVHIKIPFSSEDAPHDMVPVSIKIRGLNGGHSGSDIHLQRANANKLMGRIPVSYTHLYITLRRYR